MEIREKGALMKKSGKEGKPLLWRGTLREVEECGGEGRGKVRRTL